MDEITKLRADLRKIRSLLVMSEEDINKVIDYLSKDIGIDDTIKSPAIGFLNHPITSIEEGYDKENKKRI